MHIPLDLIDPPPVYMRYVYPDSVDFFALRDSIRDYGQHNSILVRPRPENRFQLVDGAWRLEAHRQLQRETIEAIVRDMTDDEVLLCQLQANAVRRETSRVEYAKHLLRIQKSCPNITVAQLAKYSGKSAVWVRQQLDLLDLRLEYQVMADRGQIGARNAYTLAKLPPHIQGKFIEMAMTLEPDEFAAQVAPEVQRLTMGAKERSEAMREAKSYASPRPYLRSLKEMRRELETWNACNGLLAAVKPTNVKDAFKLGVQWAMNMDPLTLEDRREKLGN